jgi:nitroreductase
MTASPDTISLQSRRRSVSPQALAAPSPTPAELETLLTIAARVPDHGKLTPWRFIVFEREGQARAGDILAEVYRAANPDTHPKRIELERKRLSFAPLVVAVVSRAAPHEKIPEWEQIMSAGAVCMNLVLAANAMGFATSWLTEWYAYDRQVLAQFGLADHEKIAGFIHIGQSTMDVEDRVRPALGDLLTRF